jgi:hypothetical protein
MPKRLIISQRAARNYIIDALVATLENDLDGTGANYLYENLSKADSKMAVTAARKLLKELEGLKKP